MEEYIESCRQTTWCPAPGCSNVIECTKPGATLQAVDIQCDCGHKFCFKCKQEAHRPIDCDTLV